MPTPLDWQKECFIESKFVEKLVLFNAFSRILVCSYTHFMHTTARTLLLFLIVTALFFGCATGEYSDIETGLTFSSVDLTVQDVKVSIDAPTSEEESAAIASNKVPFDHKLHVNIIGSEGWTVVKERAHIGSSLVICDANNKVIVDESDLLDKYFPYGVPKDQLLEFDVFFEIEETLVVGETYNLDLVLYDKPGGGFINVNMAIVHE